MIEINIAKDGKITARGLIPGQVIFLTLPGGTCYRITRLGMQANVCVNMETGEEV